MNNSFLIFLTFIAFLLGLIIGVGSSKGFMQQEAIRAGAGQFNPKTGNFEFIKKP